MGKQREPSKTPHNKSRPPGVNHRFVLWGFAKYKWQEQNDADREIRTLIGTMFWFIFWTLSWIFTAKVSVVFVIPATTLSLIGVMVLVKIIKHQFTTAWNKYFPEYQEFKQEYKPKRKQTTERMVTLSELFEEDKEESKKQKQRQNQRADIITDYNKKERMGDFR